MKLEQLGGKEIDGFGQTILFAIAVVGTGYNVWILPGIYDQTFRLCYEHPRGHINAPPVNYKLQFHASHDGFASPLWCINIAAGIKFTPEGRL
jgi:hypothetical protein